MVNRNGERAKLITFRAIPTKPSTTLISLRRKPQPRLATTTLREINMAANDGLAGALSEGLSKGLHQPHPREAVKHRSGTCAAEVQLAAILRSGGSSR